MLYDNLLFFLPSSLSHAFTTPFHPVSPNPLDSHGLT